MKSLTVISFLLFSFFVKSSETENPIVEKRGYYFSISSNSKLGDSNIWTSNYYKGFIDENKWSRKEKIQICAYKKSVPQLFDLVREENEFMIEEDFIERIVTGEKTKTAEIRNLLTESQRTFKKSARKNIKLSIVYGTFKFIENKSNVKEYEENITSHSYRKIGIIGEEEIHFLDLVDYSDLRILNTDENEKIKVKRNCR